MPSKINSSVALSIYSMGRDGISYPNIANIFGVSVGTVFDICKCKTHKCLGLKPLNNRTRISAKEKVLINSQLILTSGCWEWKNCLVDGYGVIFVNGKSMKSHRLSYEVFVGEIPKGMHVCHRCDNRACVNPDHLFLGTNLDNMRDKVSKGRQSRSSMPGSRHPMSVLSEPDVVEILGMIESGVHIAEIASKFNVTDGNIRHIKKGSRWRHIPRKILTQQP